MSFPLADLCRVLPVPVTGPCARCDRPNDDGTLWRTSETGGLCDDCFLGRRPAQLTLALEAA